jgi:archaellum component FlaC
MAIRIEIKAVCDVCGIPEDGVDDLIAVCHGCDNGMREDVDRLEQEIKALNEEISDLTDEIIILKGHR